MKTKSKPHVLIMTAIAAVMIAGIWSCNKNDDPSLTELREDKLQYLEDSLRISDSLKRINQAGIVNYAIVIVNGSTSSIYSNGTFGREEKTATVVDGAVVTIGQYGKTATATTDASGLVVFQGFFRSSVTVTVTKAGFTTVTYLSAVNLTSSTSNGTISFVGNIIPLFETAGNNTATISGKATIQTNLTNKTRENVPDGTKILASIDTRNASFAQKFLTASVKNIQPLTSGCGCDVVIAGEIMQASYQTGVVGTVTGGNYSLTVPSAQDGLPIALEYSEIGADQTLFESDNAAGGVGQRTIVNRVVFNNNFPSGPLAVLPVSSGVTIDFESYKVQAQATAVVSTSAGTVDRINVTDGGSGYIAATPPPILITTSGTGSGATATATVGANGKVTGITLTNPGSGYTGIVTATPVSGSGASAAAGLQVNGTVVSVQITNSGSGYIAPPAVTFPAPGGTGTTALGTANIDGLGRVISITITNPGSGYTVDPGALTIGAPPAGGVQATATSFYSGQSVANVTIGGGGGSNYTYAPTVTFSAPQRANGVRATGVATVDPVTRRVIGIQITDAGSGYTAAPTITLDAGSGATLEVWMTGGTVISADITTQGDGYAYPPTVVFGSATTGGGSGAAGTAVLVNGKVVGINITNGGSGYTSAPDIKLISGTGAKAYATVTSGVITGITVTDGGHDFAGTPRVTITPNAPANAGGGATATATVAGGQITTIAIGTGGSGYLEGNTPAVEERFSATKGTAMLTKTGMAYVNDVYYGTGAVRNPN